MDAWERRSARREPWIGRWLMAAVVAGVAVGAAVVAGGRGGSGSLTLPEHPIGGAQPTAAAERLTAGRPAFRAGETWLCPAGYRVRSYTPAGVYVLPGHPVKAGSRPAACWRTAADAESAGFSRARLPRGAIAVDGVLLLPAPRSLPASCRQAARSLGFPVACPTVLPAGRGPVGCPRLHFGRVSGCVSIEPGPGFVLVADGRWLPGSPPCATCPRPDELVVTTAPADADSTLVRCGGRGGRPVSASDAPGVRSCRAVSAWPHAGKVLLRQSGGEVVYAVSVEGGSVPVVAAVANHLVLVQAADR